MSFILDALKKSEAERQRQTGPTLLELRITHPRRRYPLWTVIVVGLLAANVLVLLVFMLRRPAPSGEALGVTTAVRTAAALSAATPSSPTPASNSATGRSAVAAPALSAQTTAAGTGDGARAATDDASVAGATAHNPADDEPAIPAASAAVGSVTLQQATTADYSNLPSLSELGGNLPTLQLNLLDYSERADARYALINMHRVREGDVLPEGARVLAILRDGVAMDYRGQQFMLRPGGTVP